MGRYRFRPHRTAAAATILALVAIGVRPQTGVNLGTYILLGAALGGAFLAAAAAIRPEARRWLWALLAGLCGAYAALVAGPLLGRSADDATWVRLQEERARQELDIVVAQAEARLTGLPEFATRSLAALADPQGQGDDPFRLCAAWVREWAAAHGAGVDDSLGVVLWRDGQRLGWAGPVVPIAEADTAEPRRLFHDDRWWVLRELAEAPDAAPLRLECQLRLARVEQRPAALQSEAAIQRQVVRDARPHGRRSWGDAARGLRVVEDLVLGPADGFGVAPRLRFSAQVPPRAMQDDRRVARRDLARNFLLGAIVLAWSGAMGAAAGFWPAAWLVRWIWVQTDLVRGLALLLPASQLPAAPRQAASLLDPAYFATTFGRGWLASGADAVLSAMLAAGTAFWVWRSWRPQQATAAAPRRLWLLVFWLPATVWLLRGLWRLWQELAANSNARLIGEQVPLDAWTFWALHAVILLFSLSAALVLLLLAVRLAGGLPAGLRSAARPYWLAAGFLLVVLFNYAALSHAYSQSERDWLARKAEQIVQPQDDWIGFLLEDVLSEMAMQDAGGQDPAAAGGGSGPLRRSLPAYRLWQSSAVRDLGLPALVEVFDEDGFRTSHFATGFLRDTQYEVVAADPWRDLAGGDRSAAAGNAVFVQSETRRYPTGRERILRGEIPRASERGWLRLELPVQSWRVATVAGGRPEWEGPRAGGYRPRVEVERPLLLLLGDDSGWLDAGFAELPDADAERRIAALRAGQVAWAVVDVDGSRWLCRWAPLPADGEDGAAAGFLIGLQRPSVVDTLLDVGRLLLLDVLLLGGCVVASAVVRRRRRWQPGFQGRFLLGYLAIGVVLLLVAGSLADRQTFQRIDREARQRARDGLITAVGQLHGLLTEQARALAGSEYLDELLAGRLAAERPLGPQTMRQSMVFGPDGELLLDETLSDLDAAQAQLLLAAARESPLVVMAQPEGLYLGVLIPQDLTGILEPPHTTGNLFYRQRVDHHLLPALAEVIGGEITLRLDGEVVEASHPGRILSGENPLLAPPQLMESFHRRPSQPGLRAWPGGLAFTGGLALPALTLTAPEGLQRRALPAILAVEFPARERDYMAQRRYMALFLAGLITLLLLAAFGLAMVLTWNIFEPLRVLLGATHQLAAGDYGAPLPPAGADEVGRLAGGFATMRDRLREAQAVLADRERFLQAVLDQVPVGVVVWDAGGRLAAWNPAAATILARFYPELPAAHDPADWALRLRSDVRGQLAPDGGALTSGDGERTLRVGLAPLELGDASPHELLVCEDLTDFLAAKKSALNAELARQVAHEIKNPLTPIQLSAQLLLQAYQDRHPQLDEIVADAVQRIVEQVELLRSIAGEFMLLGRPGKLACAAVDLPGLVGEVVAGYRGGIAATAPLRVRIDGQGVPPVLGHRESLIKILGNLMQNSLDAVAAPGDLTVDVAWRVAPQAVTLLWRDNGSGLTPEVASRLFDPYFSTKSKGTGLGLAICRNLLNMMGGGISLANRDDGPGTEVAVVLPRADRVDTAAEPRGTATDP